MQNHPASSQGACVIEIGGGMFTPPSLRPSPSGPNPQLIDLFCRFLRGFLFNISAFLLPTKIHSFVPVPLFFDHPCSCESHLGGVEEKIEDSRIGHCFGSGRSNSFVTVFTHRGPQGDALRLALRANRLRFAAAAGWRYCEFFAVADPTRHPAWAKVPALLAVLPTTPGILLSLDADAFVSNYSALPASLFAVGGPAEGKAAVFTTDYDAVSPINTGCVLLSGKPEHAAWVADLLLRIYNDYPATIDSIFWEQVVPGARETLGAIVGRCAGGSPTTKAAANPLLALSPPTGLPRPR